MCFPCKTVVYSFVKFYPEVLAGAGGEFQVDPVLLFVLAFLYLYLDALESFIS